VWHDISTQISGAVAFREDTGCYVVRDASGWPMSTPEPRWQRPCRLRLLLKTRLGGLPGVCDLHHMGRCPSRVTLVRRSQVFSWGMEEQPCDSLYLEC